MSKIVTSGSPYLDIDAYAGTVAYAELLVAQDESAVAVSTAPFNESISPTVRSWDVSFHTAYIPSESDTFALIDVSDPAYFDTFVDQARVSEVIDHHPGFETYWQDRIGTGAQIEFIGAACTLVYERWQAADKLGSISVNAARLLVCGILDNTLNFGAKVTTHRDKAAYEALLEQADLPEDWTAQYFTECQASIEADVATAINNDTKQLTFSSFGEPIDVGQLTVWDGREILDQHYDAPRQALSGSGKNWFLNLISLRERASYFVADDLAVQEWLSSLLDIAFDGSVAVADRLWLRKEIIKQDLR